MATEFPAHHYLNDGYGIKSWLLTRDHKRIALLYLVSITFFFFVGGAFAVLIRLDLATPPGDLVSDDTYNQLFTMHGVVMVFFFLIPSIPAILGNFLVPLMIGARDLAFPKLNLLSWYIYMIGGLMGVYVLLTGGVDTGWTIYAPFSTRFSTTRVVPAALGIFVTGFSSILTGLNFIVTIHKMRAPGMTLVRLAALPLVDLRHQPHHHVSARPSSPSRHVLVAVERLFRFGFFDPTLGGDPVLFQHLFWFYSHPAVYIMILPAMGVISELVAAFCRKPMFGYSFVAFSSLGIAVLGFLVWGHHMFVAGQSVYASLIFSMLSFLVAIPSAIKVFNWTATMYKGSVSWQTPMLYAIGFIGLFTIGGLTGLFLASIGVDVHVTDTYFVIAHFHYIMVGGTIMGYLGGLHYWWPKISGRLYPEGLAKLSAADYLHRLQPDVLSAVHSRLSRHAAAVSRVSARVPGAERAVDGGRVDSRRRLSAADDLSGVVAALREAGRRESVGSIGPRVDHDVAAANREFPGDADGDRQSVQLSIPGGETRCITTPRLIRRSRITSTASISSRKPLRSACGCSC